MLTILATFSLLQTIVIYFLYNRYVEIEKSIGKGSEGISDKIRELRFEVYKLKAPPKYDVGDIIEGHVVYEVEFVEHGMAGACWIYRGIKGKRKKEFLDTRVFFEYTSKL